MLALLHPQGVFAPNKLPFELRSDYVPSSVATERYHVCLAGRHKAWAPRLFDALRALTNGATIPLPNSPSQRTPLQSLTGLHHRPRNFLWESARDFDT